MRRSCKTGRLVKSSGVSKCLYATGTSVNANNSQKNSSSQAPPPASRSSSNEARQKKVDEYYKQQQQQSKENPRKQKPRLPYSQQLRRLKERENYIPYNIDEIQPLRLLGRSMVGSDDMIYSTLQSYALTVSHGATVYGRPSFRLLSTLPNSSVTSGDRALKVTPAKTDLNVFNLLPSSATVKLPNTITLDSYKTLFRGVRRAISDSPFIFVLDSQLPGSATRIRLITDNLSTAIWAKTNLPPPPGLLSVQLTTIPLHERNLWFPTMG